MSNLLAKLVMMISIPLIISGCPSVKALPSPAAIPTVPSVTPTSIVESTAPITLSASISETTVSAGSLPPSIVVTDTSGLSVKSVGVGDDDNVILISGENTEKYTVGNDLVVYAKTETGPEIPIAKVRIFQNNPDTLSAQIIFHNRYFRIQGGLRVDNQVEKLNAGELEPVPFITASGYFFQQPDITNNRAIIRIFHAANLEVNSILDVMEYNVFDNKVIGVLPVTPPTKLRVVQVDPGRLAIVELMEGNWPSLGTLVSLSSSQTLFSNMKFSLDGTDENNQLIGPLPSFPLGIDHVIVAFDYHISNITEATYQWFFEGGERTDRATFILKPQYSRYIFHNHINGGGFTKPGTYEFRLYIDGKLELAKSIKTSFAPLIGPITICESITEFEQPENPTHILPKGTKDIKSTFVFANLQKGQALTILLARKNEAKEFDIIGNQEFYTISESDMFMRYGHTWSTSDGTPYEPGWYLIAILVDGKLQRESDLFEIR